MLYKKMVFYCPLTAGDKQLPFFVFIPPKALSNRPLWHEVYQPEGNLTQLSSHAKIYGNKLYSILGMLEKQNLHAVERKEGYSNQSCNFVIDVS